MQTQISYDYSHMQTKWDKYSSLRTRPRRILEKNESCFFPPVKQPICIHPLVEKLGEEAKQYILTQTMYKYMNDIANVELDVITDTSLMIANNHFSYEFPLDVRHDLLSIVIDETYHAYVARDFMEQVIEQTGIAPLSLPKETDLSAALNHSLGQLEKDIQDEFKLVAVCISEVALTADIFYVAKEKGLSKTFLYVMRDHALDEGRHVKIFKPVLKMFWENLPKEKQQNIMRIIPSFFKHYLNPDLQKVFDVRILNSLGMPKSEIETVIEDTHVGYSIENLSTNSIITNVVDLLEYAQILNDQPIRKAFIKEGFLSQ